MKPTDPEREGRARTATNPGPAAVRRRRLRLTILLLALVGLLGVAGGLTTYWRSRPQVYRPGEEMGQITSRLARDLPEGAPEVRLTDVTEAAGLHGFRSFEGPRSSQLPEDMGSGAAWGDYDNDGDEDLFLVSSGGALTSAPEQRAPSQLFENLGDGSFRLVEEFPELRIVGMAAAWGDADADGWLDLVVTGFNTLRLYRNERGRLVRDERFEEPPGFWAGVSWGDADNDRRLDLYVCGYVRYVAHEGDRARTSRQFDQVVPYTLNPSSYEPERNLLFMNLGDGRFREAGEELGVANENGRSLAALWHDVDADGWLDLYVANDVSDNVLYRNLGGRFVEISQSAWVADYRGAMGLALGDYNRDGDEDIFITHWVAQENALYDSLLVDYSTPPARPAGAPRDAPPNDPHVPAALRYMDVADMVGLGQIALQMIGWGTEFVDLDADGWLDLLVANGSTFETEDVPRRLKPQPPFVFWNREGRAFHDLAPTSATLTTAHVGRGLAVADYDRDGDQDVLIVHHGEGARLLRNDMQRGHWLEVRLRSLGPAREPTGFGDGATVIVQAGDITLRRTVTASSYLSQSSRTLHFGLGDVSRVDQLEVRWLGGQSPVFAGLDVNALVELREGDPEVRVLRSAGGVPATVAADRSSPGPPLAGRERAGRFWSVQRAAMQALRVDGNLPEAIRLLREALALDPDHEDARYYLANALAATGDVDAAAGELQTLVARNPRSHRGLKRMGVLRADAARDRQDLREAMAWLDRALAVNPEETGVLLAMGEIGLRLGEHERADERLAWACRTNPRAVSGFFLRAYLAWTRGDDAGARELLRQAREARGEDWKPEGTTAEGDTARRLAGDATPLSRYWSQWDGTLEPDAAFAALDAFLAQDVIGGR